MFVRNGSNLSEQHYNTTAALFYCPSELLFKIIWYDIDKPHSRLHVIHIEFYGSIWRKTSDHTKYPVQQNKIDISRARTCALEWSWLKGLPNMVHVQHSTRASSG